MGLVVCCKNAIAEMGSITGEAFTGLNIVGGGSQNVVLNQMTANLTGLPVYAGPTEGTALGNLATQMIAAGEFATLADFRKALPGSFDILTFEPKEALTNTPSPATSAWPNDGWLQGWHERNGGNLIYRLTKEEVAEMTPFFDETPRP